MVVHSVKIEIYNIKDSDVIHFPVLFLKGIITCDNCNLLSGTLFVQNENSSSDHLVSQVFYFERIPHRCKKLVKLLYIIPKNDDGKFQSSPTADNTAQSACKRIVLGAKLIQTLIAERLYEQGFGRKTINLFFDDEYEPVCLIHQSRHSRTEFHQLPSEEIWNLTAKELLENNHITESIKVLAFLSCTELTNAIKISSREQYIEALANTKAYVACGKGHLAMLGSTGLHSWASELNDVIQNLTSKLPVDSNLFDDSSFRGTMGGCYSTTLGSALHELGHALNLVHAETGIMARGFEDIDVFFTVKNQFFSPPMTVDIRIEVKPLQVSKGTSHFQSGLRSTTEEIGLSQDGRAYFHPSAAILLSRHPWLSEDQSPSSSAIQVSGLEVKSVNGLRLIELHSEGGDLIQFWDFSRNLLPLRRFSLNIFHVKNYPNSSILVQDCTGTLVNHLIQLPS